MKRSKEKSGCVSGDTLVAYMYGELAQSEKEVFEAHLGACQACIDEFAEVSYARFDVYDWQRSEFAPLATPVIRFEGEVERSSFTARLRRILLPVPVWAVAALVFVAAGIAAVALLRSTETNETAANVRAPQLAAATSEARQTDAEQVGPGKIETKAVPGSAHENARAAAARWKPAPKNLHAPQMVRMAAAPGPRNVSRLHTVASQKSRDSSLAPRLNDFSEEEDDGLRLAELFDDVDTIY